MTNPIDEKTYPAHLTRDDVILLLDCIECRFEVAGIYPFRGNDLQSLQKAERKLRAVDELAKAEWLAAGPDLAPTIRQQKAFAKKHGVKTP